MLSANEAGLSAADVVALCSMGASTKTASTEQTGRKGGLQPREIHIWVVSSAFSIDFTTAQCVLSLLS